MDQQHEDNESHEGEDKVIQKSKYVKIGSFSLSLISLDGTSSTCDRIFTIHITCSVSTYAFIYNAFGIPLAAGLLYPFKGQLLSPMIAALAMSMSSVSVITNALRLRGTSK